MVGKYHNGNQLRVDFQVHLHRSNYGLDDVLAHMEQIELGAAGILSYPFENEINFPLSKAERYELVRGDRVIKATNKENGRRLYLFLGKELESSDGWHLLAIGTKIKYDTTAKRPLEAYIEEGLANVEILILDHPYADPERGFADIPKKKERQLRRIAEKYGKEIAFEWNGYSKPFVRKWFASRILRAACSDVNVKLENLAEEYDLRVIPTSDTHARNKRLLNGIGVSFVTFPVSTLDFSDKTTLNYSIKAAIKSGFYGTDKHYVSFLHLFEAWWPNIRSKIKEKIVKH